jgi:hypothetical protein
MAIILATALLLGLHLRARNRHQPPGVLYDVLRKQAIAEVSPENLVRKLVPDSTELSRTPWTRLALSGQIRLYGRVPARLIIRRSKVRVLPAP